MCGMCVLVICAWLNSAASIRMLVEGFSFGELGLHQPGWDKEQKKN